MNSPAPLTWNAPSDDAAGAIPIGNGDVGAGVWMEPNGDVVMLIGKTDAWDEHSRLCKVGRLRICTNPALYTPGLAFEHHLDLATGTMTLICCEPGRSATPRTRLTLWVDAFDAALEIYAEFSTPTSVCAHLEPWRTGETQLAEHQRHQVTGKTVSDIPRAYPDTLEAGPVHTSLENRLLWYHANCDSIYRATLELQGLGDRSDSDPLRHRIFGLSVGGPGMTPRNASCLRGSQSARQQRISIHALTLAEATATAWQSDLADLVQRTESLDIVDRRAAHEQWWRAFWQRSWVNLTGGEPDETDAITTGWHCHRYLTACTGRGAFPIKFNGSIFNLPGRNRATEPAPEVTPDDRQWGAWYWFQNTRHIYWPMLAAGDFEQMRPFFDMYRNTLPLARERTRRHFGHGGAFFPETMSFWGTYSNRCYGWDPDAKPDSESINGYIRRYWQGGLELSAMMLAFFQYTGDEAFVRDTLLPVASAVVEFYDEHYPRDDQGRIRISPAQVLESVWDADNPLPEIAGLRRVLGRLLELPRSLTSDKRRHRWRGMESQLPPLPTGERDAGRVLKSAEATRGERHNVENAELYAVWPYRLFGMGLPELELARRTYHGRDIKFKVNRCWHNDIVWAAYLGLPAQARHKLAERFTLSGAFRFPAMYAFGDWPPDHDNGGVCQTTIQAMLLQPVGEKLLLLPACPTQWSVDFKLHAPDGTTVACRAADGRVLELDVQPAHREADITITEPWR